jgi:hypothetical protein
VAFVLLSGLLPSRQVPDLADGLSDHTPASITHRLPKFSLRRGFRAVAISSGGGSRA